MLFTADRIRALVREEAVHRDVYISPELFELEIERIFGRAWLIVGHESQVRQPGDFVTTYMGRQPVILTRSGSGDIKVLFNRCAHRGATLCPRDKGHVEQFVCPYHGWTYDLDGSLKSVPVPEGYEAGFADRKPHLGIAEVARVGHYRGFVFASLSPDGPSLDDHLGYMRTSLDDLVDRAPDGEIEIAGGVAKHVYNGNWKFVVENHNDTIHPRFVHASSVAAARLQREDAHTDGAGDIAIRQMKQNGAPDEVWERIGLWVADYGHSFMGDYHDDKKLLKATEDPVDRTYRARLEARIGADRMREILSVMRFNTIIYPNLSFMSQFGQLRIVHPLAVDKTAVHTYVFRLKGAPDEMFHRAVSFANIVNGSGSLVLTDDLETYERVQLGLRTDGNPWIDNTRGLGRDRTDMSGTRLGATGTSEIYIRNQFKAWTEYMGAGGA